MTRIVAFRFGQLFRTHPDFCSNRIDDRCLPLKRNFLDSKNPKIQIKTIARLVATASIRTKEFVQLTVLGVMAVRHLVLGVVQEERGFEPVLQPQVGRTSQTKEPVRLDGERNDEFGIRSFSHC